MIQSSKAARRWRLSAKATATAAAVVATAALVAACGGGTSQFEPFIAERVFAFGDDSSVLLSDGKRYGVNGLVTTTTLQDATPDMADMRTVVIVGNAATRRVGRWVYTPRRAG